MKLKFKCSKCGSEALEEILVDVVSVTEIIGMEEDCIWPLYGDQQSEGGHVERYQCSGCGLAIRDGDDLVIGDEDLYDWLKDHGMLGDSK